MATYAQHITSRAGCGQRFSLKLAGRVLIVLFTAFFLKCVILSSGEYVLYVQVVKPYFTNITNEAQSAHCIFIGMCMYSEKMYKCFYS